jgi:hypothetical protein
MVVLTVFMAGFVLDDRDAVCRGAVDIFTWYYMQTHSRANPASYSVYFGSSFPGLKVGGSQITHLHYMPRYRVCVALCPCPPYAMMV